MKRDKRVIHYSDFDSQKKINFSKKLRRYYESQAIFNMLNKLQLKKKIFFTYSNGVEKSQ